MRKPKKKLTRKAINKPVVATDKSLLDPQQCSKVAHEMGTQIMESIDTWLTAANKKSKIKFKVNGHFHTLTYAEIMSNVSFNLIFMFAQKIATFTTQHADNKHQQDVYLQLLENFANSFNQVRFSELSRIRLLQATQNTPIGSERHAKH